MSHLIQINISHQAKMGHKSFDHLGRHICSYNLNITEFDLPDLI